MSMAKLPRELLALNHILISSSPSPSALENKTSYLKIILAQ